MLNLRARNLRIPQAYYLLDETVLGGFLQEPSKREVLHVCTAQDDLMEEERIKG
jgi:AP-1 complex subunit sigma 1/2